MARFTGVGLFASVSYDEGQTWPDRRLIVGPEEPVTNANGVPPNTNGYLATTQTRDGRIQLVTSKQALRLQPRVDQTTAECAEEVNSMKPTFTLLITLLFAPLIAVHADDAPKSAVEVTQELLNSIHITPRLIFDPMAAYGQKHLPFAMSSSLEVTSKGRLLDLLGGRRRRAKCLSAGELQRRPREVLARSCVRYRPSGPHFENGQASGVFIHSGDGPRSQITKISIGTRLGSFWCDPKGRLWLFFHQSVGMFRLAVAATGLCAVTILMRRSPCGPSRFTSASAHRSTNPSCARTANGF